VRDQGGGQRGPFPAGRLRRSRQKAVAESLEEQCQNLAAARRIAKLISRPHRARSSPTTPAARFWTADHCPRPAGRMWCARGGLAFAFIRYRAHRPGPGHAGSLDVARTYFRARASDRSCEPFRSPDPYTRPGASTVGAAGIIAPDIETADKAAHAAGSGGRRGSSQNKGAEKRGDDGGRREGRCRTIESYMAREPMSGALIVNIESVAGHCCPR